MKKLLLASVLAIASVPANAQSFHDQLLRFWCKLKPVRSILLFPKIPRIAGIKATVFIDLKMTQVAKNTMDNQNLRLG